mmetsp:Transcript_46099/g.128169  ORF Transcript_46099/g.128169 Transcript_46099/m.128169 type:complete len:206 (-) Transcript_46099:259-876(-)
MPKRVPETGQVQHHHSSIPMKGFYQGDYATAYNDYHCLDPQLHFDALHDRRSNGKYSGRPADQPHGHSSVRPDLKDMTEASARNTSAIRTAGTVFVRLPGPQPVVLGKVENLPTKPLRGGLDRRLGGERDLEGRKHMVAPPKAKVLTMPTHPILAPTPRAGQDYEYGRFTPRRRHCPRHDILPLQEHLTILREPIQLAGTWPPVP